MSTTRIIKQLGSVTVQKRVITGENTPGHETLSLFGLKKLTGPEHFLKMSSRKNAPDCSKIDFTKNREKLMLSGQPKSALLMLRQRCSIWCDAVAMRVCNRLWQNAWMHAKLPELPPVSMSLRSQPRLLPPLIVTNRGEQHCESSVWQDPSPRRFHNPPGSCCVSNSGFRSFNWKTQRGKHQCETEHHWHGQWPWRFYICLDSCCKGMALNNTGDRDGCDQAPASVSKSSSASFHD